MRRLKFPLEMQKAVNHQMQEWMETRGSPSDWDGNGIFNFPTGDNNRQERNRKRLLAVDGHIYGWPKGRVYKVKFHNITPEGVAEIQPFLNDFNRKKSFDFYDENDRKLICKSVYPSVAHVDNKFSQDRDFLELYFIARSHSHWQEFKQTIENNLYIALLMGVPVFITQADQALNVLLKYIQICVKFVAKWI